MFQYNEFVRQPLEAENDDERDFPLEDIAYIRDELSVETGPGTYDI